jgi:hypothetical protein
MPCHGVRRAIAALLAACGGGDEPPAASSALTQGGDPWVPPALRVPPSAASPRGAALAARVRAKIAERDRDVYR